MVQLKVLLSWISFGQFYLYVILYIMSLKFLASVRLTTQNRKTSNIWIVFLRLFSIIILLYWSYQLYTGDDNNNNKYKHHLRNNLKKKFFSYYNIIMTII